MYIHTTLMQSVAEQRATQLRDEFARSGLHRRPDRVVVPRRRLARLASLVHPRPEPCPTC
jgi:hypothetical protein